jgi:hypothetical protein
MRCRGSCRRPCCRPCRPRCCYPCDAFNAEEKYRQCRQAGGSKAYCCDIWGPYLPPSHECNIQLFRCRPRPPCCPPRRWFRRWCRC